MEIYDRWVSLGSFCVTKFHINRFIAKKYFSLKIDNAKEAHKIILEAPQDELRRINGSNCIFDWVVVQDYARAISAITRGMEHFSFNENSLQEIRNADGKIINILSPEIGSVFPHLFVKRDYSVWRSEIDTLRPKVAHLSNEFANLRSHKTLYLMYLSAALTQSSIPEQMVTALATSRGETAKDFSLLVLSPRSDLPKDTDLISYRTMEPGEDFPGFSYYGRAASFDSAVDGFDLSAEVRNA